MKGKTWLLIIGVIIILSITSSFLPDDNNSEGITGSSVNLIEQDEIEIINDTQETSENFVRNENLFLVTYIVDGDTIEIENGERIRLICIDTPEKGEEGYKEAKEYLESLILNKNVKLKKDISERDKYNRLLRYVYLEDGTFVNEIIVKEGYAEAYWYNPDTTLCPIIQDAEDYAKKNDLRIWEEDKIEEIKNSNGDAISLENYACSSNLYNCDDFSTQAEAQKVFEYCGGVGNDIHRLDGDKDGLACESL